VLSLFPPLSTAPRYIRPRTSPRALHAPRPNSSRDIIARLAKSSTIATNATNPTRYTTNYPPVNATTHTPSRALNRIYQTYIMSFFGMGSRPQISSEQKIAQAEAEIDMVSDMYSRFVYPIASFSSYIHTLNP
jgi:hypothetical protein